MAFSKTPEIIELPEEKDTDSNRTRFSTHPPPHRKIISGSFRLSLSSDQKEIAIVYRFFAKLQNFEEEIAKPTVGGIFLRAFDTFEALPRGIKESIQSSLLTYIREKSLPHNEGEQKHQLPLPGQVNQEIIRQVFKKNRIQSMIDEACELLKHDYTDDQTRAEKIITTMIQWLQQYEVQIYATSQQLNLSTTITKLQRLLTRLRTKKVMNQKPNDPLSPPSEFPESSRTEEKDRS